MVHSYCDLIILIAKYRKIEENKMDDESETQKINCAMCPRHNAHISRARYNKYNNM